jgi:hypothetical protein
MYLSQFIIFSLLLLFFVRIQCDTSLSGTMTGAYLNYDNSPYILTGEVTIYGTTTVEAGVIMKFDTGALLVTETLLVNGNYTHPVLFTSSSSTPAMGDWKGLRLGTNSRLSYAVVEYGGYADTCLLYLANGDFITIQDSILRNTAGAAICDDTQTGEGSSVTISRNHIASAGIAYTVENMGEIYRTLQDNTIESETKGIGIYDCTGSDDSEWIIERNTVTAPIPVDYMRFAGSNYIKDNVFISNSSNQRAFHLDNYCPAGTGNADIWNNRIVGGSFEIIRSGECGNSSNLLLNNTIEDVYMYDRPIFTFISSHVNMVMASNTIRNSRVDQGPAVVISVPGGASHVYGNIFRGVTSGNDAILQLAGAASATVPLNFEFSQNSVTDSTGQFVMTVTGYIKTVSYNNLSANVYAYLVATTDSGSGVCDLTLNYWGVTDYNYIRELISDALTDNRVRAIDIAPFLDSDIMTESGIEYAFKIVTGTNVTLDSTSLQKSSIVVTSGYQLTITSNVTFLDYAHIVVEPGAFLIIDGDTVILSALQGAIHAGSLIFRPGSEVSYLSKFTLISTGYIAAIVSVGNLFINQVSIVSSTHGITSTASTQGLIIDGATFHTIEDYTFGVAIFSGPAIITNCNFIGDNGISIRSGTSIDVRDNHIEANRVGITYTYHGGSYSIITNNTIKGCNQMGIFLDSPAGTGDLYISMNRIEQSNNPMIIYGDENYCSTNNFTVHIDNNVITNCTGTIVEYSATEDPALLNKTMKCNFIVEGNDFSGNNALIATIMVTGYGSRFNKNNFDINPARPVVSYSAEYGHIYLLDFSYNKLHTLDPRVINSELIINSNAENSTVAFNPLYDDSTDSYFDLQERCHLATDGTCISSVYTCSGVAYSDLNTCSGFGECIAPDVCLCVAGRTGMNCEFAICGGPLDPDTCSGHGICDSQTSCLCDDNYGGPRCSLPKCFSILADDDSVCNYEGACIAPDACVCNSYRDGPDCSVHYDLNYNMEYSSEYALCTNVTVAISVYRNYDNGDIIPESAMIHYSLMNPVDQLLSSYLLLQTGSELIVPSTYFIYGVYYEFSIEISTPGTDRGYIFSFRIQQELNVTISIPSETIHRSYDVTVKPVATLPDCIAVSALSYEWELLYGNSVIKSGMGSEFTLAKYTLEYGEYTLSLNTTLQGESQISEQKFTVLPTNPSILIKGGNQVIKLGSNYTLQTTSTDPDNAVITGAKYAWNCMNNGTQCTSSSNITSSYLFKPTEEGIYTLSVVLTTSDNRQASTNVTIHVIAPTARLPTVTITTTIPARINKQHKFTIEAKIEPLSEISSMNLKWSLFGQDQTENILDQNTLLSSTSTRSLVFIPSGLLSGVTYTLQIEANYIGQTVKAVYATSFALFNPLKTGSLKVVPDIGYQLNTTFTFVAENWSTDLDTLPLKYSFEYLDSNNNFIPIMLLDETTTFSTQLLAGVTNQTLVRCRVQNAFGEESSITRTITIIPQIVTNGKELLNSLLEELLSENPITYHLLIAANLYSQQAPNATVLNTILDVIQKLNNTTSTSELLVQKTVALDIITKKGTVTDSKTQLKSLSVVNSLLSTGITTGSASSIVYTTVGRVISNLLSTSSSTQSYEIIQQSSNAISNLSHYILQSIGSGENATTVTTDAFSLSVVKDYASDLQEKTLSDSASGSSVFIPHTTDLTESADTVLSAEYITFASTDSVLWESRSENISSSIISFRLLDSDGNKVSFATDTDNPLVVTLSRENVTRDSSTEYVCKYLNDFSQDEEWDVVGCILDHFTDDVIVCHCNHTTSFAAFIQYTDAVPLNTIQKAVYYVSVIVYGLFCICAMVIMVFVLLQRNYQPVRSRLFAPFICLVAIIVESALLVVRSGLWLSSKPNINAINVVGYVIMFVSNPLSIVSLFIFLWQMARYFVLRHSYHLMGLDSGKAGSMKKLKILKLFTSRAVFLVLSGLVYTATLVYFLAYSVTQLSIRKKLTDTVINANVVALAVSYAGIVLILGILILVLFIWDVVVVPYQTRAYHKKMAKKRAQQQDNESPVVDVVNTVSNKVKKQVSVKELMNPLYNHFIKEDPLYFRVNAVIMVLSVLAMFVSYGIGIANRYLGRSDHSVTMILSLAFDLAYTALRIIAYGGFVATLRIIFLIRSRGNQYAEFVNSEHIEIDSAENLLNIIETVLNHKTGFELVKEYCVKEFSLENLQCYTILKTLNMDWMIMATEERKEKYKTLITTYVKGGAPCEVNIPSATRKAAMAMYNDMDKKSLSDQLKTLHKLAVAIVTNISDTFSRFSETTEYHQFIEVHIMNRVLEETMTDKKSDTSIKWFKYDVIAE